MSTIERIEDLADPTFNPYLADEVVFGDTLDPYSLIDEIRREGPVVPGLYRDRLGLPPQPELESATGGHFMVLSFAAVNQILSDPITYSNRAFEPTLGAAFGHTVSVMDPPEHTEYRKILQKAFRPNIVQHWGDGIVAPVIDELMGQIRGTGKAELVEQFARPYPFNVIYRMLGLPHEDIEVFYKLTVAQIITFPTMDNALDASAKLGRYFARMLADRRANSGTDIVSVIASTQVDGEPLPDDVAISFLRQLINAGGDTTFRTTTALLTGLLTNPDQLEAVRSDRSLIPVAVEEALRWDGPVVASERLTTADSVIDGVSVPAHALLDMLYGAANHDPAEFDHPEKFDICRERHRHFGFAFGAHNCLGQLLARLEMSRALEAILDHLPGIRVDPDYPMPHMRGAMMRTPRQLHVIFD
jgi:cytochrome P450